MSELNPHSARDTRQQRVLAWVKNTFGIQYAQNKLERARRFCEEAIELVQSVGLSKRDVLRLVHHVYAKPPGDLEDEVGGASLTLLALCEERKVSADLLEQRQLEKNESLGIEYFRKRHALKTAKGVASADDHTVVGADKQTMVALLSEEVRSQLISNMCLTMRHDFGLDKLEDSPFASGMTDDERAGLKLEMGQLVDNCMLPVLERILHGEAEEATYG